MPFKHETIHEERKKNTVEKKQCMCSDWFCQCYGLSALPGFSMNVWDWESSFALAWPGGTVPSMKLLWSPPPWRQLIGAFHMRLDYLYKWCLCLQRSIEIMFFFCSASVDGFQHLPIKKWAPWNILPLMAALTFCFYWGWNTLGRSLNISQY